jgi:glycosyltransferase involved in cell wall biosynthesis
VKRLPISVCVISGAEAQRIGKCLESVAQWTNEIVVVLNSEVTDDTEAIAASFGAKVFREPWKGFVGQKNSAADKAVSPWLLNLDADEIVTPELAREIAGVVSAAAPHQVYEFPRCTFYCGRWIRHGDWYPDRVRRLWQRGAVRWAGDDPHASLEIRGTVGRLGSDLLHHTADSINRQIAKTVEYADTFAWRSLELGRNATAIDLALRPVWRFGRAYVLKMGFLDGWQGFTIAWLTAFYTFLRYARLRESQPRQPPKP